MANEWSYLILVGGVFAGAVVSGFAGFAFSAVAGIVLMHLMPPVRAVPLMMACSVAVQGASLIALRNCMRWKQSLPYMIGGAAGIPLALYLLHHLGASILRIGFGSLIAAYAGYMLISPMVSRPHKKASEYRDEHAGAAAAIGFGGGLIGGFTAMPGAVPTIWCNLRGLSKNEQRGLVQPYIAVMQCFAIALLLASGGFSGGTFLDLLLSLPALAAGAALGIFLFGKIGHASYRRAILLILLAGGAALIV